MAHSLGQEYSEVDGISIVDDYVILVRKHDYYLVGDVKVTRGRMMEIVTPDEDLSGDEWYMTDEVRAVAAAQFDDESKAEWGAMTQQQKDDYLGDESFTFDS